MDLTCSFRGFADQVRSHLTGVGRRRAVSNHEGRSRWMMDRATEMDADGKSQYNSFSTVHVSQLGTTNGQNKSQEAEHCLESKHDHASNGNSAQEVQHECSSLQQSAQLSPQSSRKDRNPEKATQLNIQVCSDASKDRDHVRHTPRNVCVKKTLTLRNAGHSNCEQSNIMSPGSFADCANQTDRGSQRAVKLESIANNTVVYANGKK